MCEKGNTMDQMKGNLLLLLTALIWGSAFVAQSVGMDYVGPFTFNAARNLLATGVLVPVVLAFGGVRQGSLWQRLRPDAVTVKAGLCCGVIMGVASNLQQVGIAQTTAGKAGFITALYIILVPILGRFLGRTVRKILLLCVYPWPWWDSTCSASPGISPYPSGISWCSCVRCSLPSTSCAWIISC